MWNRKERRDRSCEPVEPSPESARETQVGLIGCDLCRDFCGVVVEQRNGFTKIVGVHCLNCETTIPVGEGFIIWPVSPLAGGAP